MLITYVLLMTVFTLGLSLLWSTDTIANTLFRVFLVIMTVWGIGLMINNFQLFTITP